MATGNTTGVKRAPDFASTGEYVVTLQSGHVERIYRDALQFTYAVWYVVGREERGSCDFTKAEVLARLEREDSARVSVQAGAL